MKRRDKLRHPLLLWLFAAALGCSCSRSLATGSAPQPSTQPSTSAPSSSQATEKKEETETEVKEEAKEEAEEAKEEAAAALDAEGPTPASLPASALKTEEITKDDMRYLAARNLLLPVKGILSSQLRDTYKAPRSGGRTHKANDIMAPHNTPVLAAASGTIHKLHTSKNGGISIYQQDAGGPYIYYYAHLTRYAKGLEEGQKVRRGEVIGYVGTTGNARGRNPHLHFGITKVIDPRKWWRGTSVNPYPLLTKKEKEEKAPEKEKKADKKKATGKKKKK